jgi:hypothetical protein
LQFVFFCINVQSLPNYSLPLAYLNHIHWHPTSFDSVVKSMFANCTKLNCKCQLRSKWTYDNSKLYRQKCSDKKIEKLPTPISHKTHLDHCHQMHSQHPGCCMRDLPKSDTEIQSSNLYCIWHNPPELVLQHVHPYPRYNGFCKHQPRTSTLCIRFTGHCQDQMLPFQFA